MIERIKLLISAPFPCVSLKFGENNFILMFLVAHLLTYRKFYLLLL